MPGFQLPLGSVSFLQPRTRTRLVSQASVEVTAGASCVNGFDFCLSSILGSDHWTRAKPCLAISFVVSFEEDSSFSFASQRAFLKQLGKTLSEAELWSQLQLRADVSIPCDDLKTNGQNYMTLGLEIRQQQAAHQNQPEQASQRSDELCKVGNVRPPSGVSTYALCAVNIALRFSCIRSTALVPRKRPTAEVDVSLDVFDPPVISRGGMLRPLICDERFIDGEKEQVAASQSVRNESPGEILDDTNVAVLLTSHYASSEESFADLFSSASGNCSDDTRSLAFSSQGSSVLRPEEASPAAASGSSSDLQIPSMNALVDGALRNSICPRPIRTAPGIRLEKPTLGARLTDIAPSTFSPGYKEAVAAQAPLVPTVARFLTSFLQKARSPSVAAKKREMIHQFPGKKSAEHLEGAGQSPNEETKLKEVVKTHLWMTMTNGLRDPEPARRLKPLQASSKPNVVDSDGLPGIEISIKRCSGFDRSSDDGMLEEDYAARSEPIYHEAGTESGMQALDEDDHEPDLIEEYEERLCRGSNHGKADELKLKRASDDITCNSLSPMLEGQGEFPHFDPIGKLVRTPLTRSLHISSARPPTDVPTTPRIGSDGKWSNLLDEASRPELGGIGNTDRFPRPNSWTEHDSEPDLEQWEFDREQGFDEMLFE